MLKRLLPTLIIFGAGFAALLWGLLVLQSIFSDEADEAHAVVRAQRTTLEQHAAQVLKERLNQTLQEAGPLIERALADPLAPATGLLLWEDGKRRLPRSIRFRPGTDTPARKIYKKLRTGRIRPGPPATAEPESPWERRMRLLYELMQAVTTRKSRRVVETAFRSILAHRSRYIVTSTRDLPYMLALVDFFLTASQPDPTLLRMLLRDGIPLGGGQRLEGLQRHLLSARFRFTRPDFAFLRDRLIALCARSNVPYDDFQARAFETPGATVVLPTRVTGPTLVLRGHYVIDREPEAPTRDDGTTDQQQALARRLGLAAEQRPSNAAPRGVRPRRPSNRVRGVQVELAHHLREITRIMRSRRLLGQADRIGLARRIPGVTPVATLPLHAHSPTWKKRRAEIDRRYQLKTVLGIICLGLAGIIVILAVVLQLKKHRYLQLKSDFVATVSHELRTPLASIRLQAETLERRARGLPEVAEYPQRIVRDVEGLGFLVENILSFNRLDKGRWKPSFRFLRFDRLIEELEPEIAGATEARVAVDVEDIDGVGLEADADLLRILFLNLGRNACLYNSRDPAEIRFSAQTQGRKLVLRIHDNGVGIAAEEQERIFKEFYRAQDRTGRGPRGSGLGLAMCRRVMSLHSGSIRIAESSSEGTTFELIFPRRA